MKTNQILVVGGVIIVILLGILFFINKPAPTKVGSPSTAPTGTEQTNDDTKSNLTGLLAMGKSLQCTFNLENSSQGTVYISGNQMRGDFTTITDAKSQQMSMIKSGDYSYMWGSALPQGIKMKLSEKAPANDTTKQFYNPDQEMNYNCQPWASNNGLFTPPADVTFQDMSVMMEKIQEQTGVLKNSQCAACDNLDAQSKEICRKQLNCQ